jgi:geranylgeranyl pyrophosphate synthase
MAEATLRAADHDRALIDAALAKVCATSHDGVSPRVWMAIRYALAGGGKRLRGQLVLAAYRACGGTGDASLLAAATEVVHAYSLVHDDLPCMDNDDLRRGRPTVHRVFDNATATSAGAAMIPLAVSVATEGGAKLGLTAGETNGIIGRLMVASGAAGMVGGQDMDLEAEHAPAQLAHLESIHRAKTGALIEASTCIGGIAARADAVALLALADYGGDLGLAFQIIDDVLDVTASSNETGKTSLRDQSLGKSTYPALLGIDGARERASALGARACARLREVGKLSADLEGLVRVAIERRW